jgi:hypothetical protein
MNELNILVMSFNNFTGREVTRYAAALYDLKNISKYINLKNSSDPIFIENKNGKYLIFNKEFIYDKTSLYSLITIFTEKYKTLNVLKNDVKINLEVLKY